MGAYHPRLYFSRGRDGLPTPLGISSLTLYQELQQEPQQELQQELHGELDSWNVYTVHVLSALYQCTCLVPEQCVFRMHAFATGAYCSVLLPY